MPRGTAAPIDTTVDGASSLAWLATQGRWSSTPAPARRRRRCSGRRRAQPAGHPQLLPRPAPGERHRLPARRRRARHRAGSVAARARRRARRRRAGRGDRSASTRRSLAAGRRRAAARPPARARSPARTAGRRERRLGARRAAGRRAVPGCASGDHGDADDVVRAHLRRVAPLASARRRRATRARRRRPARRPRRARRAARPTRRSTRCSSTPTATSGSSATADLHRAGDIAAADLAVVVERILAPLGRRLDRTSPIVDARLPDGSRVCAVMPPIAADGACLSIRRFRDRSLPARRRSAPATSPPCSPSSSTPAATCVVGGATSAGKTSLLDAVLGLVRHRRAHRHDRGHRRAAAGDRHLVRLEARPATRRRSSRRSRSSSSCARRCACDPTAWSSARCAAPRCSASSRRLNTGHDGSWSTCHANSALDALHRLETLVVQAAPAWPLAAVRQQLTRSIDVVVHVVRAADGGAASRRGRRGRHRAASASPSSRSSTADPSSAHLTRSRT